VRIVSVPCLSDNFAYLVTCPTTGATAVVDPGEPGPIETALAAAGLTPSAIWCTHHHPDHVGGVAALAARFPGVAVIGHASDASRIAGLTRGVVAGDRVAARRADRDDHREPRPHQRRDQLLDRGRRRGGGVHRRHAVRRRLRPDVRGHAAADARVAGAAGGAAAATRVYFGHEYTAANLRFAAAVEPGNPAIAARAAAIDAARPTTPSTIADELATNPFLRVAEPAVRAAAVAFDASVDPADGAAVFGAIRRWKDGFRG
jgi:hydroxyacylglutathione hydrolase